jgi:hypothetical protein
VTLEQEVRKEIQDLRDLKAQKVTLEQEVRKEIQDLREHKE